MIFIWISFFTTEPNLLDLNPEVQVKVQGLPGPDLQVLVKSGQTQTRPDHGQSISYHSKNRQNANYVPACYGMALNSYLIFYILSLFGLVDIIIRFKGEHMLDTW